MAKEERKVCIRRQKKSYKTKKWKQARDGTNATNGFEKNDRSDLGKKENLFIHKEDENQKPLPGTVAASSVLSAV